MKKWYLNYSDFNSLREYRLVTMEDISKKTGIALNTLYRMQRGEKVRTSTIKTVAEFLSVLYNRDEKGIYFYIKDENTYEVKIKNNSVRELKPLTYFNITEQDTKLLTILKEENITIDEIKDALNHIRVRRRHPDFNAIYKALIEMNDKGKENNNSKE